MERSTSRLTALAALAAVAALATTARTHAQAAELPKHDVTEPGVVERVTVYPQRAAVTRVLRQEMSQGLWTVKVANLPAGIDPATLQAKVSVGGDSAAVSAPKLLGVEYGESAGVAFGGSPEGVEMAKKIDAMKRDLAQLAAEAKILEGQDKLADQVGVRAAANATADGGTAKQDLGQTAKNLAWVRGEKARLLTAARELAEKDRTMKRDLAALEATFAQKGGASRTERSALVQLAVPQQTAVELEVTYVVPKATWAPAYAIRASGDRSDVAIEYDAVVAQSTGEDWTNVALALSTAEPSRASAPPSVAPAYVDVWVPVVASASSRAGRPGYAYKERRYGAEPTAGNSKPGAADADAAGASGAEAISALAASAGINEAGVATTFAIPRRVSVPSDSAKTQRTRIASFEPGARFVYAAAPLVTEAVFLRGDLVNSSGYELLPGVAQIFMGGDFIGETRMPAVAPKSEFEVYFGPDRAIRARREVVSRNTGNTGLFGGSLATVWKYRVMLDNGTGRDIDLELLDRRPVSRNEKIEIKIADLSKPLSTNANYLATLQPQGILRWDLTVPAGARGAGAMALTWTVQVTRAKDIETTPLPD